MGARTAIEETTGRKFYLDDPDDLRPGEAVTFLLSLHGGGSTGAWQRAYFPACDFKEAHRLVIATPSCATKTPFRRWVGEADDAHLRAIVEQVFAQYGRETIRALWLVGHSQGGMTANRLLREDEFFKQRVDGWLSLSGGRIGPITLPADFFPPGPDGRPVTIPRLAGAPRPGEAFAPDCECSFIFATGEREIAALPENSPWAEKYGAGARVRQADIIDAAPGKIHDTTREGRSTPAWGLRPAPGVAQWWLYPDARDGRVIADVVRLEKGHTEGLEPRVTETLVRLMANAPGGKAQRL